MPPFATTRPAAALAAGILLLAAGIAAGGEGEWREALAVLEEAESLDAEGVGYGGEKSETFLAYERFRDGAPLEEVLRRTEDPRPVVRCYAVRALAEKHPGVDLAPILRKHLGDTTPVRTFTGCLVDEEMTGDAMLDLVRDRLPAAALAAFHETLIFEGSTLAERGRALRTLDLPAALLPRLRPLAAAGDGAALVAVARHRRPEDLPLLLRALSRPPAEVLGGGQDALDAAALFPDPSLLGALEALVPAARAAVREVRPHAAGPLVRALVAQRSRRAAALVEGFLAVEGIPEFRRPHLPEMVLEALEPPRDPLFAPLLRRLWREFGETDGEALELLFRVEPEATAAGCEADLSRNAAGIRDGAVGTRVAILERTDRARAVAALAAGLPAAGPIHTRLLAREAARIRDDALLAPLLGVLEARTNPHEFLAAARALFAFGRPGVDRQVADLVARRPELRSGWGGERLARMLEEKPRAWEE